jgi:glutamine cyclotransferase
VKGEILANIWMTDRIARIDPATGQVIDWIDISRLTRKQRLTNPDAVPNGIALSMRRMTGCSSPEILAKTV